MNRKVIYVEETELDSDMQVNSFMLEPRLLNLKSFTSFYLIT